MTPFARTFLSISCLSLACLSACGPADPLARQEVSGLITLDSKPLEQGAVHFVPVGETGHPSGASIHNGKFHVPREKGLPPGQYTVRVFSSSGEYEPASDNPSGTLREPRDLIPPRFNINSELEANVEKGGRNEFNFDLTSS